MYTVDDIVARLKNGETSDTIADEMAKILNDAVAKKTADDEARKAYDAKQRLKVTAANKIIDSIIEFLKEYYPNLTADAAEVTGEDFINLCDSTEHFVISVGKIDDVKGNIDAKFNAAFTSLEDFVKDMKW